LKIRVLFRRSCGFCIAVSVLPFPGLSLPPTDLKRKLIIQKITAIWLLLVFAVSASPKAYFHELLANHKDTAGCNQVHNTAAVHQQGYHCHFDELVVTAHFVLAADAPELLSAKGPHIYPCAYYTSPLSSGTIHHESRGPPAA
jgi:hypothetical protein